MTKVPAEMSWRILQKTTVTTFIPSGHHGEGGSHPTREAQTNSEPGNSIRLSFQSLTLTHSALKVTAQHNKRGVKNMSCANPLDSLTGCKLLLSVPGEDTDGIKVCLCLCWLLFCFSPFEDIPDEGGNVSLMNITRNVMPMK